LACVVTNPSKDNGLVLVYPDSGKITYWENIDSAESLKLFSRGRQGVEGTLKVSSSEHVVEIVDTETAGVVLLTNSGRLAHITLQDAYGNPHITVSSLAGGGKGGFFGDLVTVFQSGWRNRISTVRSRQVTKGRVEIMALQEDGVFKVWETIEGRQPNFVGDYEFSQMVRDSLEELGIVQPDQKFGMKFLSFAQVRGISQEVLNDAFALHCIIVAQIDISAKSRLVVLEAMITSSRQSIYRILPITVHNPSKADDSTRLLFAGSDETIFIIQGLSVVVVSWPRPTDMVEDGPVQLVKYFQDSIRLRDHNSNQILAVSTEEYSHPGTHSRRTPSGMLLFTRSSGILKITPTAYNPKTHSPTAESKLEQKVFFGPVSNVLDLDDLTSFSFTTEEIEAAALRVSDNILQSNSDLIPQSATLMESHLTLRMKALQDLATHLKKSYPDVSRATRWRLLFDAEKLAAARALWRKHDEAREAKSAKEISLLEEAIDAAIERHKDDDRSQIDDTDDVRFWFARHVNNLEKLFPISFGLIKNKHRNDNLGTKELLRLVREFNDLVVCTLGTAFEFRQRNAPDYSLEKEDLEDGLLQDGFKGLPKFWTSDYEMIRAVSWSIDLSHDVVSAILIKADEAKNMSNAIVTQAEELASRMDIVVKLSCKSYMEGYRWLLDQDSKEDIDKGHEMKETFEQKIRHEQIVALYDMGQGQKGLALAEEFEDISALSQLSLLELDEQKALQPLASKGKSKQAPTEGLDRIQKQISHYFRKFGQEFSSLFYGQQVESHRLADLIDKDLGIDDERTAFLRSDPSCGKLSWINEAVHENDLVQVGNSLMEVAKSRENNVWSKGLELSLAKLALRSIPGSREPSVAQNDMETETEAAVAQQLLLRNERELIIWKIQQQLFAHVRPTVLEAVDEEGALTSIMQTFATETSKNHPALAQLLKLGFSDLISHRTMNAYDLIDVLTLMDQISPQSSPVEPSSSVTEDQSIVGKETNLALKVLNAAVLSPESEDTLARLIWKRCLLRDNWIYLGRTNYKSDRSIDEKLMNTAVFEAIKNGIKDGKIVILFTTLPYP
jgi:nuclear pore complex protein Nup133